MQASSKHIDDHKSPGRVLAPLEMHWEPRARRFPRLYWEGPVQDRRLGSPVHPSLGSWSLGQVYASVSLVLHGITTEPPSWVAVNSHVRPGGQRLPQQVLVMGLGPCGVGGCEDNTGQMYWKALGQ